jgi:hypothetical protein
VCSDKLSGNAQVDVVFVYGVYAASVSDCKQDRRSDIIKQQQAAAAASSNLIFVVQNLNSTFTVAKRAFQSLQCHLFRSDTAT